jgi:hypothetical protein
MKFLQKIFWLRAKFNFHLVVSWISTKTTVADAISHLDFVRFHLCSGIPLSGVSGIALSPPCPPPSLLSPYANSLKFRNLLKWLRTSSLPKQETSYWLLMHDPCNVLKRPRGRFLFGFALPTPMTPSERVFIRFATFLHIEGYAISTIFAYLAGIPSFYATLGISVSLSRLECPLLYLF